jgi:hypothetical protein
MLKQRTIPDSNILELTVDGKITHEELADIGAQLDRILLEHDQVRILEVVHQVGLIEPRALWEDLRLAKKHMKRLSHLAVVADQKWVEWMTAAIKPFIPTDVRFFHRDEIEQARQWLQEAPDEVQPPQPTAPAAPPGN